MSAPQLLAQIALISYAGDDVIAHARIVREYEKYEISGSSGIRKFGIFSNFQT